MGGTQLSRQEEDYRAWKEMRDYRQSVFNGVARRRVTQDKPKKYITFLWNVTD
jgi:hypothetical protein